MNFPKSLLRKFPAEKCPSTRHQTPDIIKTQDKIPLILFLDPETQYTLVEGVQGYIPVFQPFVVHKGFLRVLVAQYLIFNIFIIFIFKASNEIEAYTSPPVYLLTYWLTHSSVRLMLLYPIWSMSPGSRLVFNCPLFLFYLNLSPHRLRIFCYYCTVCFLKCSHYLVNIIKRLIKWKLIHLPSVYIYPLVFYSKLLGFNCLLLSVHIALGT